MGKIYEAEEIIDICKDGILIGKNITESLANTKFMDFEFRNCDLSYTDVSSCEFHNVIFNNCNLKNTLLNDSKFKNITIRHCNLNYAVLRNSIFEGACDIIATSLVNANLSGVRGLLPPIEFIKDNFETTPEGIIVYKTFGEFYDPPENWLIEEGSVIQEEVNFDRTTDCGCGINVSTLIYHGITDNKIWKCLIKWEWLPGICVPYATSDKFRTSKLKLLERI